jgi:hypothetical protein
MTIIKETFNWLTCNARGKWFETSRFKNKETGEYLHPIERNMILARIEIENKEKIIRAFYWLYSIEDAMKLNEYVSHNMKSEMHEIIISTKTRFFIDFDLKVDAKIFNIYDMENNKQNLDIIGNKIALLLNQLLLCSIEEHGIDTETEMDHYDWMYTMRNREDKLSIHFITNLFISLDHSIAISADMKKIIIDDPYQFNIDMDMAQIIYDSIDTTQYRHHGSLSLPFGFKKKKYINRIHKQYDSPNQMYFITIPDAISLRTVNLSQYGVIEKTNTINNVCTEFVKKALLEINMIPDYSTDYWDLDSSSLKGSTMYLRRLQPSYCSICNRSHDSDNTLFLMFNSELGIASWKCSRSFNEKPKIFYRESISINETQFDEFINANKNILEQCEPFIEKPMNNQTKEISQEHKLIMKYKITNGEELEEPLDQYELSRMKSFKKKHSMIAAGKTIIQSIKLNIQVQDDEELDYV